MDFVAANGTSKWAEFAKIVGTKTRFACRCRYSTIKKYLERNPNAELKNVPRKDKSRSTTVNLDNYLEAASKLKAAREEPSNIPLTAENIKKVIPQDNKTYKNIGRTKLLMEKNGKQLFQYFKYAYNWRFAPERIPRLFATEDTERTFTMLQLMDFELDLNRFHANFTRLTTEDQTNLTLALNIEISTQMKDDIRYVKSFGNKFPANFNTVLAWRAMQMMLIDRPFVKVERPHAGEYTSKYNIFIRRFKQIFYWTALLSKMDVAMVKDRLSVKATKEDFNAVIENEAICSADEDEFIEISAEQEFIEEETEESDGENAVDFLLSHIQRKSVEKISQASIALSMPDDVDFSNSVIEIEETCIKSEEKTEKRRHGQEENSSNNDSKRPRKISAAAKSMPLT